MTEKTRRQLSAVFLLITALWVSGCAPVFPREITDRVDRHIAFKELLAEPGKFKGSWVMLGGVIVSSRNAKEGTYIEILQRPLESDGRPVDTDATEGRFLVRTEEYLDSAVFHRGRLITVVGEVDGETTMPLDETTYRYPVLASKSMHLWKPSSGPRFFFGVGVFHRL